MRSFRLLLMLFVGGLVFAQAVPASAITLAAGYNEFDIITRDNGTVYALGAPAGYQFQNKGDSIGNPNNVALGIANMDAYPLQLPPAGGMPGTIGATEDSWGIAKNLNIIDDVGGTVWNHLTANTELGWVFYGAEDFYSEIVDNVGTTTNQSVGLIAELWEEPVPTGTPIDLTQGSPWRGPNANDYTGVTEGEMLLQLTSTAGFIHVPGDLGGALVEFETEFNTVAISSTGLAYFDVTGGTLADFFDTDDYMTPASGINFANGLIPSQWCDAWIQFSATPSGDGPNPTQNPVDPNAPFDWLLDNTDPVRTYVVPEPVTMAGLMLGIGSLVGYVRRRRR